jgi:two-component system CheB/CheR fusion protein
VLQRKTMSTFHYALKPNGHLILGASESVGGASDLFTLQDRKAKIYLKKSGVGRPFLTLGGRPVDAPVVAGMLPPARTNHSEPALAELQKQADRVLLTHFSPAGVLINKHMEVLQFRGRTGPFLEHAHGEASLNLLKMAHESLLLDLRTVVTRAIKQNTRVRRAGARITQNNRQLEVTIEVIPYGVPPFPEKFYLVLFETEAIRVAPVGKASARAQNGRPPGDALELARLQEELAATRESLESIVEEQEATVEELRSANEEIMSSNEEMQSTNEELETTKEELQSTNEELTTLNDELESRNSEMEQVNNDLHNVLASVSIPIIILGPDLKIRRFTGMAEKVLNLIPSDVGRPVTDINLPLEIPDLPKLVLEVIDQLSTKELESRDRHGHWWSVRIRPYKTSDNKIDGAVVALLDIDLMKASAYVLAEGRAFAGAMINAMSVPALLLDQDLSVQAANQAFYRDFRVRPEDTLNRQMEVLGNGQWDIARLRTQLEEILQRDASFDNFVVELTFPQLGRRKMKLEAHRLTLRGGQQNVILLTFEDVTKKA